MTVIACTGNYEQPKEVDPKGYNKIIETGKKANEEWVNNPESIARKLFPRISHQEGNPYYAIKETRFSDVSRKITVTEEGAIDDQVLGVKNIIYLKLIDNQWKITTCYISLKLRL